MRAVPDVRRSTIVLFPLRMRTCRRPAVAGLTRATRVSGLPTSELPWNRALRSGRTRTARVLDATCPYRAWKVPGARTSVLIRKAPWLFVRACATVLPFRCRRMGTRADAGTRAPLKTAGLPSATGVDAFRESA
jgi:hypothetical protein